MKKEVSEIIDRMGALNRIRKDPKRTIFFNQKMIEGVDRMYSECVEELSSLVNKDDDSYNSAD